jgi:hypothetical protein
MRCDLPVMQLLPNLTAVPGFAWNRCLALASGETEAVDDDRFDRAGILAPIDLLEAPLKIA